MVDVKQIIDGIEENRGKQFTEQERKVLEGFGEMLNMLWNNQGNKELTQR